MSWITETLWRNDAFSGNRFNSSFNIIQFFHSTQIQPDFSKQHDDRDGFDDDEDDDDDGDVDNDDDKDKDWKSQVVFYKGRVRWVGPLLFPNSPLCDNANVTKTQKPNPPSPPLLNHHHHPLHHHHHHHRHRHYPHVLK